MSDRLAELRRQHALVEEHLAWLSAEIASAEHQASALSPTPNPGLAHAFPSMPQTPVQPKTGGLITPSASPVPSAPPADEILEQYRIAPSVLQQDVRKGCFLYFAVAFSVFAVCVAVLYYVLTGR